jgi:regulatory protein
VKIVAINKKGRNYTIKFDDMSTLFLDEDLLTKYNLYEDQELSDAELRAIISDSEYRKAYASALRILARRSHSVSELRTKLKQKKHTNDAVNKVFDKLVELNYLNDEKFAEEYIEYAVRTKKFGSIRISHELRKRGINRDLIDKSLAGRDEEIFQNNAASLAEKKLNTLNVDNLEKEKIRHKLFSYLQQKGYTSDIIYQVLNNMNY